MYKREILGQFVGLICVPLERSYNCGLYTAYTADPKVPPHERVDRVGPPPLATLLYISYYHKNRQNNAANPKSEINNVL